MKWLWGLVIPSVLTAMVWLFRGVPTPSHFLMIYLLGVFFVAIRFGLWPSIIGALTSVAVFAFFFAPPIFSFAIADPENLFGVSVMLVVATVTSKLAETMRTQTQVAEHRAHRASALYRLSKELAEARQASEIMAIGMRHIQTEFGGRNAFLCLGPSGGLVYPVQAGPVWLDQDLAVAHWVFDNACMAGRGTQHFSADPALYLPLQSPAGLLGVLALEVVDFHKVFASEQFQLLDTFVDQIMHSLERADLAAKAEEATLKMQAEALRNSLLSSISHDLRTPLATIIGAASTLETDLGLDEANKQKLVGAISEEALRMSDLMTKLLEMARLEAGDVVLNRQWHSPEEMVGSALRRLDKKLKSRQVKVTMADRFALVHVDAVLLQQVLVNLLDNAAKYSPPGSPIDIVVETYGQGFSISVANTGEGIPKALQQKIFDKFFRICPESAQSGVGLGLSICRAIVGAHGGDIQATTDQGRTVFQLHLPFLEAPPTIAPEEKELLP